MLPSVLFISAPHLQRVVRKDCHTVVSFILYGQNEPSSYSSLFRSSLYHHESCAFVVLLFRGYEKMLEKHECSRLFGDGVGLVVVMI